MIFLPSNIYDSHIFHHPAANLTAALDAHNIPYRFLPNAKDIWLRDFMDLLTKAKNLLEPTVVPAE